MYKRTKEGILWKNFENKNQLLTKWKVFFNLNSYPLKSLHILDSVIIIHSTWIDIYKYYKLRTLWNNYTPENMKAERLSLHSQ